MRNVKFGVPRSPHSFHFCRFVVFFLVVLVSLYFVSGRFVLVQLVIYFVFLYNFWFSVNMYYSKTQMFRLSRYSYLLVLHLNPL